MRSYHFSIVFRDGVVVLIQLDPYRYRFHVEQLTARAQGVFDVSAFVDPGRDDLMVATPGWIAELFGGGEHVVGTVLAVYPVVVAALTCPIAYVVARWVTDDWRAGIAAATVLAIFPGHVYRTALGFSDHHAFDYLLLALTFLLIVSIVRGTAERSSQRRRVLLTGVLGSILAAQMLAWSGSPLLVAPYILFAVYQFVSVLRSDERPAMTAVPLVIALALATGLTALAVKTLSWQSAEFVRLLLAPTLVLTVVAGLSEAEHKRNWQSWQVGTGLLVGGSVAAVDAWRLFPAIQQTVSQRC